MGGLGGGLSLALSQQASWIEHHGTEEKRGDPRQNRRILISVLGERERRRGGGGGGLLLLGSCERRRRRCCNRVITGGPGWTCAYDGLDSVHASN